jgi:hypothetical protein
MASTKGMHAGAPESALEEKQIDAFLAKYTAEMILAGRDARARMRARVPGGVEFVYDNYNALVFGFGPTERPSEAVLSLALMPRWVTLCFLKGASMPDPKKLLKGSGSTVRNVRLESPAMLDDPAVRELIDDAIRGAVPSYPRTSTPPRTIIKSVSAKQRPRRPSTASKPRRKSS